LTTWHYILSAELTERTPSDCFFGDLATGLPLNYNNGGLKIPTLFCPFQRYGPKKTAFSTCLQILGIININLPSKIFRDNSEA